MSEQKEIAMQVSGMTCAACAARIEKGLKRMPGVTDANVNLATETSNVTYDPAETGTEKIQEKIEKLGYHVVTEKAEFDIEGMTCAACANRIEKRLNKLEGVTNAPVNFALETVTVEYNPKEAAVSDFKEAVDKLGYKLKLKGDEDSEAAASKKKEERQRNSETDLFSYSVISFAVGNGEPFYIYFVHLGAGFIPQSVDAICPCDSGAVFDRLAVLRRRI